MAQLDSERRVELAGEDEAEQGGCGDEPRRAHAEAEEEHARSTAASPPSTKSTIAARARLRGDQGHERERADVDAVQQGAGATGDGGAAGSSGPLTATKTNAGRKMPTRGHERAPGPPST